MAAELIREGWSAWVKEIGSGQKGEAFNARVADWLASGNTLEVVLTKEAFSDPVAWGEGMSIRELAESIKEEAETVVLRVAKLASPNGNGFTSLEVSTNGEGLVRVKATIKDGSNPFGLFFPDQIVDLRPVLQQK